MAMMHTKKALAPPVITITISHQPCQVRHTSKVGKALLMQLKHPS